MDDLTSYYAPPIHHPYYQPTPPPSPGTYHQPPSAVSHPIHVQPQFVTYASPLYPQSSNDQLRTLFVAGFPEVVKPREIYNLFREFPGYQSSNLRSPTSSNSQPFAFATFVDQQSAVMALQALSGIVFYLEKGSTLYIDLAKSNSRSKRCRSDDEGQSSDKRLKGYSTFERSYDPAGVDSIHMPGIGNSAYNTIGYPSTQSFGSVDGGLVNAAAKSSNTPCPTIFVANLGPSCSEEELTHVFSRCRARMELQCHL
ncbi:uncharacterized protein [Primulina eburnea]|uniref:uncharacterized protein isoform X6 n=1 Tax=Primulina eburnea TaxID=1245227 RepID=UPI003C6CB7BE